MNPADYQTLFEDNPQPMWVYDLESLTFLAVNRAAVERYGYSREELLAMTIKDIRPPEDLPALLANVAQVGPGTNVSGGWRHRKRDGTLIDVEITSRPVTFAGRRAELVLPYEMTERNRSEAELGRLAAIVESSDSAIIGTTLGGVLTSWNAGAERLYGYSAQEAIGRRVDFLVPAERHHESAAILDKIFRGEREEGLETVRVHKDGSRLEVSLTAFPVHDSQGRIVAAAARYRDNSGPRKARLALEESERHFRTLIENASDIIAVLDPEGTLRYVSPATERVLGYPPEELLQRSVFDFVHPEDRAAAVERLALREEMPKSPLPAEIRFRHRDGSFRVLQTRATALRDPGGAEAGFVFNVRDVTNQRHLEEQLRQATKMEAVGRLAGGVAHDFNNLLTAILGYSELALLSLGESDPVRADLEEIRRAGERATALTRQLLTFSRKQAIQPRVLDLGAVVTDLGKLLRRLIGEDIEIVTWAQEGTGAVNADRGHIEQILVNLCVNAREAMPGGGRIEIELANADLDEAYAQQHMGVAPGAYVMLSVTDTGTGMDAETQRHLFEPFFTTREHGTGLGLATVYGIVKQSGGSIWVNTEPGRGTTFTIYLPRCDAGVAAESTAGDDLELPRGEETILLLEDNDLVRGMVTRALQASGYEVIAASTAGEAEAALRDRGGRVDLVVSDVIMPGMGGSEAVALLRAIAPDLKVLYMSGYAGDATHSRGYLEPGVDFLQKPFTTSRLARKVRGILDRDPEAPPATSD